MLCALDDRRSPAATTLIKHVRYIVAVTGMKKPYVSGSGVGVDSSTV